MALTIKWIIKGVLLEIVDYVLAARSGDAKAFTKLIEMNQNLALGYAYSKLGDFVQAQDVVQDSFLIAFSKLNELENPEVFSGWLRGIVHFRCHRVFRTKGRNWSSLNDFSEEVDDGVDLNEIIQKRQEKEHLMNAIKSLPELQRTVVSLYYLEEQSQKAVADFLELPVSKVNNYLHEARETLKGRLLEMAKDSFREQRLSEEFAKNIGEIVSVHGSLVETKVNKAERATIFDVLGSKTRANRPGADLVVVQRMKNGRFRCISTGSEVSDKAKLYNQGDSEKALRELSEDHIISIVDQIASKKDKPFLETGIKVIDLLCPIRDGGSIGVFGKDGVGRAVLVMELLKRKQEIKGDLNLFFYVNRESLKSTQDILNDELGKELGITSDINENVQTAWIYHDSAGDPTYAKEASYLDTRLYFSPLKGIQNIWPTIDPLNSFSKSFSKETLGEKHFEVASRALDVMKKAHALFLDSIHLEMMALGARREAARRKLEFNKQRLSELSGENLLIAKRSLLLDQYFTQPFFVAEEFTKMKGVAVSLNDTIEGAHRILEGEFDDVSPKDLSMKGAI
ncbi:MAG: sigma-70 family RNA polymerase sigma factor [Bacteriovoracaceae bacterium]|nr:sigma-70 family RNA polymerase sigma factor [Bacteriovoracaceae bacterium]